MSSTSRPTSSPTSRATACSSVSPGSTKPASSAKKPGRQPGELGDLQAGQDQHPAAGEREDERVGLELGGGEHAQPAIRMACWPHAPGRPPPFTGEMHAETTANPRLASLGMRTGSLKVP